MKNPLTAIPDNVRQLVYAALVVAATIFSAYQAADGDWNEFVGGVLTALINLMAAANVSKKRQV